MRKRILRYVRRVSSEDGVSTSRLDEVARHIGLPPSKRNLMLIVEQIRKLLDEGELKTITEDREDASRACWIVPADYDDPSVPGDGFTPWRDCEPFGLPDDVDE